MRNEELADALEQDWHMCADDRCRADRHEAAQRLRAMPEGERIGYVPLADFRRAVAVTGEFGDPMVPASLTPIWQDSIPVTIHERKEGESR